MIAKSIKIVFWGLCTIVGVFLVLVLALLWDWGRSSAHTERDNPIQKRASPDGKFVAEIHTFTTAMWGGPDILYVGIRRSDRPDLEKVFSRTYECSDLSAYGLEWESSENLTIRYGECNPSPFAHTPVENAKENKVWLHEGSWNGITIHYEDAHQEATH